jgi:sulfur-oxidizing protein SoxY
LCSFVSAALAAAHNKETIPMQVQRRGVLGALAGALSHRLLAPLTLFAPSIAWSAWPKAAFDATSPAEALNHLFKGETAEASDAIQITAPDIAENGSVVPVTVQTSLKGVKSVTLLAEENPRALVAQHTLSPRAAVPLSVRMRLGKSQNIVALVETEDGKLLKASKQVKVTLGGCGG